MKRFRERTTSLRPAEPFLFAASHLARRLGHADVGTEHLLRVLLDHPDGAVTRVLLQLGVTPDAVQRALAGRLDPVAARIDPAALAALGIDFEAVRERLEQTFGRGALERTRAGCLGVCPQAKRVLAHALDLADGEPLAGEHILLGMLSVPDSVAARVLSELGVTFDAAEAAFRGPR